MQKKILLVFILLISLVINASAFKIRSSWVNGQKYVYLSDIAGFYGMDLKQLDKCCKLQSRYSDITFNYNSKLSEINGVIVYLSLPAIQKITGKSSSLLLSEKDFLYLLDPVLRKDVLIKQKVKTVVIDPGHGGKDPGGRGKKSKEKDIVLQVAKRLSIILNKAGYKIILTRDTDIFPSLSARPAIAEKYNADIFISLHCNIGSNSKTTGIETFIYTPEGTSATYGGKISDTEKGNKFDKNNSRLGYEIQKKLLLMEASDRGVKHARFKVLRICPVPAVLIELGFLSSPVEEAKLLTPNYQYLLAYRIAQGISNYSKAVN